MSNIWEEFATVRFTTSLYPEQLTQSGARCSIDWPPIICPECWATRFAFNDQTAQCFYCGRVLMRWRK